MKKRLMMLAAALSGGALAQNAEQIVARVQSAQQNLKDVSFKVAGTAELEGGAQKIDLDVQAIPAAKLARITFNAPDALADNVVVVDGDKVRNYLFLTNEITEQDVSKTSAAQGLGVDFTQFADAGAALSERFDVKLLKTQGAAGQRLYLLEGLPKNGGLERTRVWVAEQGWRPVRFQVLGSGGKVVTDLNVTNYKTNAGLSGAKVRSLPRDATVRR